MQNRFFFYILTFPPRGCRIKCTIIIASHLVFSHFMTLNYDTINIVQSSPRLHHVVTVVTPNQRVFFFSYFSFPHTARMSLKIAASKKLEHTYKPHEVSSDLNIVIQHWHCKRVRKNQQKISPRLKKNPQMWPIRTFLAYRRLRACPTRQHVS